MRRRNLIILIPIFILYILIFRFIYLEDGLSTILSVCIPIFLGLFLATILNPILVFLQNNIGIQSRCFAVLLTYTIFFGVISLVIVIITPSIVDSISQLLKDIPKLFYVANNFLLNLSEEYAFLEGTDTLYNLLLKYLYDFSQRFSSVLSAFLNFAIDKVINVIIAVGNLLLATIISIYILIDKENLEKWISNLCYSIFERKNAKEIIKYGYSLYNNISNFIVAKLIDSSITGVMIFIGSKYIIKTPYPIIDGIIIGTTNIIPYFGSFIGAIPIVLINSLYNHHKGFLILIMILIVQEIDGLIIGPKIMSNKLSIKPVIVIISLILGGGLFGPMGLLLATPVAALIKTSIDAYIKYQLSAKKIIKSTIVDKAVDNCLKKL
ncbi:AI-2E family transporter [Sedimentibacter sp. MB31-C6]|uniref:AI-2E family transporter n=1 Tax=Sedimentibacter sp. MB31-C6 TaxID=3109366 RepID=UPI002DDD3B9F|nr:AI-2E family transporter [Sedimentibacter sp. MB36-C1]WSI05536.1 AI-2E family transporter [Sedimentibacter sp. MB36-C1]